MAFCTNCGAKLEDGVRFCTNCGAPVEQPPTPADDEVRGEAKDFPQEDDGIQREADGLDALDGPDAFDWVDETTIVDEQTTMVTPSVTPAAGGASARNASAKLPPTMPPQYPEEPAPAGPPRRRKSTGAIVAITLGIVTAVLLVGFGVFYFVNPLGLTDGIFADSAAAHAAAAEAAQAEADEAKQQLEEAQEENEKAQTENEELQKQLDEANRQNEENRQNAANGSGTGSSSGSGNGGNGSGGSDTGRYITAPAGYPRVEIDASGYVLPNSQTEEISDADIEGMNDWELCVARNEVLARHGYAFIRDDLAEFFSQMPWYEPNPNFSEGVMTDIEWRNMNKILDLEHTRNSQYTD